MTKIDFKTHASNWRNWMILILCVILIITLVGQCRGPEPQKDPKRDVRDSIISAERQLVEKLRVEREAILKEKEAGRLQAIENKKIYVAREKELSRELAEARADIQPLVDSLPKVKRYVAAVDSAAKVDKARIVQLEREKEFQAYTYDKLIYSHQAESAGKSVIIETQTAIISDQDKTIEKQGRLIKILNWTWKIGLPAAFIGGVIVGNQ